MIKERDVIKIMLPQKILKINCKWGNFKAFRDNSPYLSNQTLNVIWEVKVTKNLEA